MDSALELVGLALVVRALPWLSVAIAGAGLVILIVMLMSDGPEKPGR